MARLIRMPPIGVKIDDGHLHRALYLFLAI